MKQVKVKLWGVSMEGRSAGSLVSLTYSFCLRKVLPQLPKPESLPTWEALEEVLKLK